MLKYHTMSNTCQKTEVIAHALLLVSPIVAPRVADSTQACFTEIIRKFIVYITKHQSGCLLSSQSSYVLVNFEYNSPQCWQLNIRVDSTAIMSMLSIRPPFEQSTPFSGHGILSGHSTFGLQVAPLTWFTQSAHNRCVWLCSARL